MSDGHERNLFGNGGAEGIKNEAFYWVVVKSAKSIRGIKTMMVGVEVAVEPVICVHGSVPKILPSVNHKAMITISKMFDRLEKKMLTMQEAFAKQGYPTSTSNGQLLHHYSSVPVPLLFFQAQVKLHQLPKATGYSWPQDGPS